ncbi:MAG: hypothetical protein JEZ12_08705 [Desulfobacterium sp.]|nr:hypothetical protein [Desulfobacterium sp.]
MKKQDVPQDPGIIEDYGYELCYAVDNKGAYDLVPSIGWEPKNIANDQAWEVIDKDVAQALEGVRNGTLSPVAYYMAKHQMDLGLLSQYTGFYQWQVKRHLKPKVFEKLKEKALMTYASLFEVSITALKSIPESTGPTTR